MSAEKLKEPRAALLLTPMSPPTETRPGRESLRMSPLEATETLSFTEISEGRMTSPPLIATHTRDPKAWPFRAEQRRGGSRLGLVGGVGGGLEEYC